MSDPTVTLGSPNFSTGIIPAVYLYNTKNYTRTVNMVFDPPTQRTQSGYSAAQTLLRAQELIPALIIKIQTGAIRAD